MCIIISKENGVEPLDMGYFERAWDHNGDGGGVVWKEKGKRAYIQKGFMKKEDMLEKLKEINKKDTSFIAHFRIRSVGEVKPENTHPFVMDKITFAHNGTLSITPIEGKTDSETFGLTFLKDKTMHWVKQNQKLLEMALGSSKFAIMDNKTGEILILNKEKGKEQDGAWFSNASADKPVSVPARTTDYDFTMSSYNTGGGFEPWTIKARKFFGTKSYTGNSFSSYSKDKKCWVYASGVPTSTYPFTTDVVIGRNGLYKLNILLQPTEDDIVKKHHYQHRDPAYKMLGDFQRKLQKDLAYYWKQSFEYMPDRDEWENDLNMENLVLDSARRFVANGLELSYENLWNFVMGGLTVSKYATPNTVRDTNIMIEQANDYICQMFGYEC